mgnify:CR=1 FL=1
MEQLTLRSRLFLAMLYQKEIHMTRNISCLLYTSDAADERSSVDLGGRRIIKKKNNTDILAPRTQKAKNTTE